MKINLLLNTNDIRSGYVNIDPFATQSDPDKVRGSVCDLSEHVHDGEAVDILAMDVIDYVGSTQTNEVISHWLKKLRHGGTITIGGIDLREVAHAVVHNKISLTEANILLYGTQSVPKDYRKATLTIQHVIQMFLDQGMKLERKQVNQYHYFVTARRL